MTNRLAAAMSPYLRQHADNPVDWWPWEPGAFAEARRRGVPVLLSVGYAACHWCHVMAHESFEDPELAAYLNEHFVPVKVDREERPDVDAVYMAATQAMTGHGGWPMTCFLTADGDPFHCGTYYPSASRGGLPSFTQLLRAVVRAWTHDGDRVRTAAKDVTSRLAGVSGTLPAAEVDPGALDAAVASLAGEFDARAGGFGGAPKFPPSAVLEFLLRHHERTGSAQARAMATTTHARMARGGLFDQLAGGFARYSVDGYWVVPHFEKMLYDNALLLRSYAHEARLGGEGADLARRVVDATVTFLLRDLRTAGGGFASALDADAAGVEGSTYVWTPEQLIEVLGDEDGAWAAELLVVTRSGTFDGGASTLQMPVDPDGPGATERWSAVRRALLTARAGRPAPDRDDKIVAAWNGLAITALAEAAGATGRTDWLAAARRAATMVLRVHLVDGRLRRTSRDGVPGAAPAVLEDHAALAGGLLALHQATGEATWLESAQHLLDLALDHFADAEPGRFFDTADDAETLVTRPREVTDGSSPCGSSLLADALLTASVLVDPERSGRYRDAADAALREAGSLLARYARFAGGWLTVAEAAARGPLQVAVAGPAQGPGRAARDRLEAAARAAAPGGTAVVAAEPDAAGVPLLAGRPLVDGAAAAYLCRGFVCERPTTSAEDLAAALGR